MKKIIQLHILRIGNKNSSQLQYCINHCRLIASLSYCEKGKDKLSYEDYVDLCQQVGVEDYINQLLFDVYMKDD